MINYIEKGKWLHDAIEAKGYQISHKDNVAVLTRIDGGFYDEVEAQTIIDSFDSLPYAQAEAIKAISQHADDLISKNINPIKQRRLNADALGASIKKGKGAIQPSEQAKLDNYEAALIYPNAIFNQYDIEEAAILAQTDWKLIDMEAAKANLDGVS